MKQNFRPVPPVEVIFKPETASDLTCTLLPEKVRLCSISRENRPQCAYGILKMVFFSDSASLFSISETEDEISMLIADDKLDEFPEDALTVSDLWRPIQRFKKTSYSTYTWQAAYILNTESNSRLSKPKLVSSQHYQHPFRRVIYQCCI